MVERLVPLVVATAAAASEAAASAAAADGVELVDEDDAGSGPAGLCEERADAGGATADVELDELRGGDGEEGDS